MENPHTERQNVLLERILRNVEKCTESLEEASFSMAQLAERNENMVIAADLALRYKKNIAYNLEATGLLPSAEIEKRTSGDS